MGWGKSLKKFEKKWLKTVAKAATAPITYPTRYAADAIDSVAGSHISSGVRGLQDKLTDPNRVNREHKKDLREINAAETAAKNAADADYYDQIMKSRRRQIADAAGSKTNFTTEDGALGAFDDNVPGAFDPVSGAFGKKKKVNA